VIEVITKCIFLGVPCEDSFRGTLEPAIQAVASRFGPRANYIEQRRGSVDQPLSATEITQKFRRLAESSRSEAEIDELIETVSRLETQPSLLRLVQLITTLRDQ
jgi:hypothetical protein